MEAVEINHAGETINLKSFQTLDLKHGDIIALQTKGDIDNKTMMNMARSIGNFVKVHNEQFPQKQVNAIILPPKCAISVIRPVEQQHTSEESDGIAHEESAAK